MSTNIDYWEKILLNPTPLYKKLFEAEKAFLFSHIRPGSIVLDIGCGDGRTIESISDITQNATGIDSDSKAVEDARTKLKAFPGIRIIQGNALALPFSSGDFDHVLIMDTLVNFAENKVTLLKEAHRALSEEGSLIISVYSEDALPGRLEMYEKSGSPIRKIEGTKVVFDVPSGANESEQFSKEEIVQMAKTAGFRVAECQKVEGIAYVLEMKKG